MIEEIPGDITPSDDTTEQIPLNTPSIIQLAAQIVELDLPESHPKFGSFIPCVMLNPDLKDSKKFKDLKRIDAFYATLIKRLAQEQLMFRKANGAALALAMSTPPKKRIILEGGES